MTAYLSKMTVKNLREIADRMGIKFGSKALKSEIVSVLSVEIHNDYVEAFNMNEAMVTYTIEGTDIVLAGRGALVMIHHMNAVKRFNPTLRRDKKGFVILTAKQLKRVNKKNRSYAKSIGFFELAA